MIPGHGSLFVGRGHPDAVAIVEGITCGVNARYVLTVTGDCADAATPCSCVADLNGDCLVNTEDLTILLDDFGCTGTACVADINGDGVVDTGDLGILLNRFGCQDS